MELEEKEKSTNIFDSTEEITSLFDTIIETENSPVKTEIEKETPLNEKIEDSISLFNETASQVEEKQEEYSNSETPYSSVVKALLEADETFEIYDDVDKDKSDYTKEEVIELYNYNTSIKGQAIAQTILDEAISKLSPTLQKVITGELQGIKLADIAKDLEDFNEIESIPENPSKELKEKIVRKYYNRLATERKKDQEWVNKKIESIIDREELDDEFEDAKTLISQDLDKKQKEKEAEIIQKQKEKEDFKKIHNYFVSETLKEENLFNIKLSKEQKGQIASVLSTFAVRPKDNKEKLGLTALIDNFIHNENPKESYKRLALMSLAAVAPDKLVESLKNSAQKEVANEAMRGFKTANNRSSSQVEEKKITTSKKVNSVF
jgi:hypothetical protein